MRANLRPTLLFALVIGLTAFRPARTPQLPSTPVSVRAPAIPTAGNHAIFLILFENHNWSQIEGNASAPYINQTVLPMASHAAQYFNVPGVHPSLPNYLWLEAGTDFGIRDDNNPVINHQSTTSHLVTQLNNAGISWKAYQEDISGTQCPLTAQNRYAPKHNPMVYFDDVTGTNDPNSAYCIAHERPYTELAVDLANNNVASYNFITPNLCNDMHDSCAPLNDSVKQGDSWLATELPKLLNSQAYQNGGVIFITWDESVVGDGPIGLIALSPLAKGGGYVSNIRYSHSSTLRTVQELLGVAPFLGDAANASDLSDLFTTFPASARIALAPGWNLVSLPLSPTQSAVSAVLASIDGHYDRLDEYTAANLSQPWEVYAVAAPPYVNSLSTLDTQTGFWLHTSNAVTLTVTGSLLVSPSISLQIGWNLIAYPSLNVQPIDVALSSIAGKYDKVYTYVAGDSANPWKVFDPNGPPASNTLTQMEPGRAYWIHATAPAPRVFP